MKTKKSEEASFIISESHWTWWRSQISRKPMTTVSNGIAYQFIEIIQNQEMETSMSFRTFLRPTSDLWRLTAHAPFPPLTFNACIRRHCMLWCNESKDMRNVDVWHQRSCKWIDLIPPRDSRTSEKVVILSETVAMYFILSTIRCHGRVKTCKENLSTDGHVLM